MFNKFSILIKNYFNLLFIAFSQRIWFTESEDLFVIAVVLQLLVAVLSAQIHVRYVRLSRLPELYPAINLAARQKTGVPGRNAVRYHSLHRPVQVLVHGT